MIELLIKKIVSGIDKIRASRMRCYLNSIDSEKDPIKKAEKKVIMHIEGIGMGGMAGGSEFIEYRSKHYDKAEQSERCYINEALIRILNSKNYKLIIRAKASYVCADIKLQSAISSIEALLELAEEDSSENRLIKRSLEALYSNESITDIVYKQLRERGEI